MEGRKGTELQYVMSKL